MKEDSLNPEAFEFMLTWLANDRDLAGSKYEHIRRSLIQIFNWHGATNAEDLADETINRVARKLPEIVHRYEGDPARYFYGVARFVLKQQQRREQQLSRHEFDLSTPRVNEGMSNEIYECLEQCLAALEAPDQELVTQYYKEEKLSKIKFRKELAQRLNLAPNALRVKVHRIRAVLESCINGCVGRKQASHD